MRRDESLVLKYLRCCSASATLTAASFCEPWPLYNKDPDLPDHEQHPWYQNTRAADAPGIYVRFLTDKRGRAPTPYQYRTVCDALLLYATGDRDQVLRIDNLTEEQTNANEIANRGPFYLDHKLHRVQKVITWCKAIEVMCMGVPHNDRHKPTATPRTYVGYARCIYARDKQYQKGEAGTWLALLVEAVFRLYFEDERIRLRTYTIGFMASAKEVSFAERALIRCTHSDTQYGGFSVAAPGQCDSAKTVRWDVAANWRDEYLALDDATRIEAARLDKPRYLSDLDRDLKLMDTRRSINELELAVEAAQAENDREREELRTLMKEFKGMDLSELADML